MKKHAKSAFFFSVDDHQTKDGRTVLLSSSLGISRSVTVAIAYYMWNKKVSLKVISVIFNPEYVSWHHEIRTKTIKNWDHYCFLDHYTN